MDTDIIIIGAGPGGYETAIKAARLGKKVVIIEKDKLGGTCLNAGCIPTKCLCHVAENLDILKMYGFQPDIAKFTKAIVHKEETVEKLRLGVATLMNIPGITFVKGEAEFVESHIVKVNNEVGEHLFSAPNVIIATGSTTKFLPIEGAHAEGVLTSKEILNIHNLPKHLCIIGGGVIGIEFASIFRSFGVEVDVVEFMKEILPSFDKDIAKRLRTSLKKRGISFHLGSAANAIRQGNPMVVEYEEKGKLKSIECDKVLMAVGRTANVSSLNLEDVGVEYTQRGIIVDEYMQTSVPGVYAIGDINGLCQLAHAATFQGYCALEHILNSWSKEYQTALSVMPSAVFTSPEVAMVGFTEEKLNESEIDYEVLKSFYRANGKALSMDEDEGLVKLLVSSEGKLLGAHILGAHASDLIHELALLMRVGGKVKDIAHTVHAHPSLSEIILAASEA